MTTVQVRTSHDCRQHILLLNRKLFWSCCHKLKNVCYVVSVLLDSNIMLDPSYWLALVSNIMFDLSYWLALVSHALRTPSTEQSTCELLW